jgi:hypothetical protein
MVQGRTLSGRIQSRVVMYDLKAVPFKRRTSGAKAQIFVELYGPTKVVP